MSTEEDNFFSRWSRRKAQVRTGQPLPEPPAPVRPVPLTPAVDPVVASAAPQTPSQTPLQPTEAKPDQPAPEIPPALTLDDVARLTREADFSPFVGRQVPAEVRNAAMKKLFTDPHYNVMDGLDIYIDDYSKPSPLSAAMMAKMVGAQFLKLVDDPNDPNDPNDAKPAAAPAAQPTAEAAAAPEPAPAQAQTQTEADSAAVAPTAQAETAAEAQADTAPDTPTGEATAPAQPKAQDDHADLQLQPDHAPERESPGRGAG
ncbi:MAG: DUF3306 domain-containing protein [Hydrogenophaga sp.]|uniref:DUF3306 domain-containing protein n=1 Tax=Hydrogenophaga sp. TaxID=1904254 RepID=UPI0027780DD0|nr:DUF3306 domain-containing protein [Hydrogenophaga sp.]MDP2418112.1 DUF3306 domain-containing protein [Hydrogenophaga sp.]MDZ4188865.1 DUF3306 domain-containing protein [Hydrogenophaga sp.]